MPISKIESAGLGVGTVLQVVQTTSTTLASTNSNSLVDSGISASITPKFATSKILVCLSIPTRKNLVNGINMALYRGGSSITGIVYGGGYNGGTSTVNSVGYSLNYLDSPATTSSTTYKIYFCCTSGGGGGGSNCSINPDGGSNDITTITLLEIAQ